MKKISLKNIFLGLIIAFIILGAIYYFFFTHKEIAISFKTGVDFETKQVIADRIYGKVLRCFVNICDIKIPRGIPFFMVEKILKPHPSIREIYNEPMASDKPL